MATSFTTHSAGQVIASADINLIQTAVNTLENASGGAGGATPGPADPAHMTTAAKAWVYDPIFCNTTFSGTDAKLALVGLYLPAAITVTKIYAFCSSGASNSTHSFAGIYANADTGSLLVGSADLVNAGNTPGLVTWTVASTSVGPGWVLAGFFCQANTGSYAAYNSTSATTNELLAGAGSRRAITQVTGLSTALPGALSGGITLSSPVMWMAIG